MKQMQRPPWIRSKCLPLLMLRFTLLYLFCCMSGGMYPDQGFAQQRDQQKRFAMIIGANIGMSHEPALRFAERDALHLSKVLTRFGDTPTHNQIVLLSPTLEDIKRGFNALRRRVERLSGDTPSSLTLYYSGHADADAFHISSQRLTFKEMKSLVASVPTSLKVILIDACRSGGFTRLKGARPSTPFTIKADPVEVKGVAVISSSSPQEDSQESDVSRGGIFTQHLITGLMGAADRSKDGQVSLNEIYEYTYKETVKSTSETIAVQHPNYSFSLRGKEEVILTKLQERKGFSFVSLSSPDPQGGIYLLIPLSTDLPLSELNVRDKQSLLIHPGKYLVRYRDRSGLFERRYTFDAQEQYGLRPDLLTQIPFGETVRRGRVFSSEIIEVKSAWALAFGGEMISPLTSNMSDRRGMGIQLERQGNSLSLHAKISGYQSRPEGIQSIDFTQYDLATHLGIGTAIDLSWITINGCIWAGGFRVQQRFSKQANTSNRVSWVGSIKPTIGLQIPLGPRLYLRSTGGPTLSILDRSTVGLTQGVGAELGWGAQLYLGAFL